MAKPTLSADKFRVFLVEDHPLFRAQLAYLIEREPDMRVVGEADNATDAIRLLETTATDILILDITLKEGSGLDLVKDLKARGVETPVLALSMHDEMLYAERMLRAGARGYITKHETSAEVVAAIRKVLGGEVYLGARMTARAVENLAGKMTGLTGVSQLTDRELQVFELIGHGRGTREICSSLHLGVSTVDTYRERIKAKLALATGAQLTHEAIRWVSESQRAATE